MLSIRRKLKKLPLSLWEIQDLGGCRAILPSIKDVKELVTACRDNFRHEFDYENDYIHLPKKSGYRSHHMIFKYCPAAEDEMAYLGRRIEIQIRTRLQHSWATAVEAVGLFRGEDLKASRGSPDWLRMFELMASEFALAEDCPLVRGAPEKSDRVREIIDLDAKLTAASTLEDMSHAVRYTDKYISGETKYYLIEYDKESLSVTVKGHVSAGGGTRAYDEIEIRSSQRNSNLNTVLVEADKIENLKAAYPNYFGDVQLFKMQLNRLTQGEQIQEFTMPPVRTARRAPREAADLSWFRPGHRRRWTEDELDDAAVDKRKSANNSSSKKRRKR